MISLETITQFIIPGIIAILSAIGAFMTVKNKTKNIKTLDELSEYLLSNVDIVNIINKLISECKNTVIEYKSLDEFIDNSIEELHGKFIIYINTHYKLPSVFVEQLSINNINYIIDKVFEKYSVNEMLENIFNENLNIVTELQPDNNLIKEVKSTEKIDSKIFNQLMDSIDNSLDSTKDNFYDE